MSAPPLLVQLASCGCRPSLLELLPGQLPEAVRRVRWGDLRAVPAELMARVVAGMPQLRAELGRL